MFILKSIYVYTEDHHVYTETLTLRRRGLPVLPVPQPERARDGLDLLQQLRPAYAIEKMMFFYDVLTPALGMLEPEFFLCEYY